MAFFFVAGWQSTILLSSHGRTDKEGERTIGADSLRLSVGKKVEH